MASKNQMTPNIPEVAELSVRFSISDMKARVAEAELRLAEAHAKIAEAQLRRIKAQHELDQIKPKT